MGPFFQTGAHASTGLLKGSAGLARAPLGPTDTGATDLLFMLGGQDTLGMGGDPEGSCGSCGQGGWLGAHKELSRTHCGEGRERSLRGVGGGRVTRGSL